MLTEIALQAHHFIGQNIVSVYFGGGTPFLLGATNISSILRSIDRLSSITGSEITIETNPESTDKQALKDYFDAGINRLSIGVQSFNNDELLLLCRRHSSYDGIQAIENACIAGFSNISVDLMYDLPHQSIQQWKRSLVAACQLPITHLSLYNLTIEAETPWFRKKARLEKSMPGSEESAAMYALAIKTATTYDFSQYEISAFAKRGFSSIHNTGYWQGRDFIGFGPSAFSFYSGTRSSNASNLAIYTKTLSQERLPVDFHDNESPPKRLREMVVVGLRMNEGINLDALEKRYNTVDEYLRNTLNSFVQSGLLSNNSCMYALTNRGRIVYDALAVELI